MTRCLIPVAPMPLFSALVWPAQSEIPAGTRFMAEIRKNLEATKVGPGTSFKARTAEALKASDGSLIPAGAKRKGPVSHATDTRAAQRNVQ